MPAFIRRAARGQSIVVGFILVCTARAAAAQTPPAQADSARPARVWLRADGNGVRALHASIVVSLDRASVSAALQIVAAQGHVNLTFDPRLPGLDGEVTIHAASIRVSEALHRILSGTGLDIAVLPGDQLVVLPRPPMPSESSAGIHGLVRDSLSDEPLADVHVEIVGTRVAAMSRNDGSFVIRPIPPGTYQLRFRRLGFVAATLGNVALADEDRDIGVIPLARAALPLEAMRVSPGQFGLMETGAGSSQTLTRDQIRNSPQLTEDVFRSANALPGVSSNDLSAKLSVRGAPDREVLTTLDGMPLYEPYHLKDFDAFLSIIGTEEIGGLDLHTGGFSAEYGNHLAGVLNMTSVEPSADGERTELGLNLTNSRAMSQGAFGSGKSAWLVAARGGYAGPLLAATGHGDQGRLNYGDIFAKAQYDLAPENRITVHVLHAGDELDLTHADWNPNIASGYASDYAWLTWDVAPRRAVHVTTLASVTRLGWNRHGENDDALDVPQDQASDRRSFSAAALRQDWTVSINADALLRLGIDAAAQSARYDYTNWQRLSAPSAAGNVTTIDSTGVQLGPRGTAFGAYATQRVRFGAAVFEAGLRYDVHTYGVGEGSLSPRFSAAWDLNPLTTVRAAWGIHYQPQAIYELQAVDGVKTFLPDDRADQVNASIERSLGSDVSARLELYDRRITREGAEFVNALDPLIPFFPELLSDRIRIDPSSGDARGIELFLRRTDGRRFNWSAGYTLARAQDLIDGRDVPRSVDQRHTVSLSASYRGASDRWLITTDWQYHSGRPFTPEYVRVDTVVTTPTARPSFVAAGELLGPYNSERLPDYHRLDVRATRFFTVRGGRLGAYFDVFNALFNKNVRSFHYEGVTRETYLQAPIIPSFGFSWAF